MPGQQANDRIEGVAWTTLARRYGTPLYVYSHRALIDNYRRLREAMAAFDPLLAYAVKANSNGAILRTLIGEGAGLDIVSGGELRRGLAAGVDPAKIVFAGVGKTGTEIEEALAAGIGLFNIESEAEAEAIARAARRLKRPARAALRVNPGVDPATHQYITTGKTENKFGVPFALARRVFERAARMPGLDLTALHCHIGSQIMKPGAYVEALGRVLELKANLEHEGHRIDTLNLGGGFGIDYERGSRPLNLNKLAARLAPLIEPANVKVIFEPGRAIAGPAGWLLTRVLYVKPGGYRQFAIVDAAMNDLMRPALYSAFHRIERLGPPRAGRARPYDIVGPICESGDFLGKARKFVSLRPGDMLLIHDTGAYGMSMASNYNSRPRAAEVMVRGRCHGLIRERERPEDLTRGECLPGFLG